MFSQKNIREEGWRGGKAQANIAALNIIYILTASKRKFWAYYETVKFYLQMLKLNKDPFDSYMLYNY